MARHLPDDERTAAGARVGNVGHRLGPTAFLLAILLASACGTSVSETYLDGPQGTPIPRARHSVRIYASGPPPRPHRDVAILEVEQTHGLNEQGTDLMIDRLRGRAAELGCDGVVIGGIRERDGFPPGSGFYLLDPGATTLHGTCIVFTGQPSAMKASKPVSPAPAPSPGVDRPPPPTAGCSCGAP